MGPERTSGDDSGQRPLADQERALLTRYAAVAFVFVGGLEWLLGRALSRLAAAPNLEGPPRALLESLGKVGLFLVSPAFVLAVLLAALAAFQIASTPSKAHRASSAGLSMLLLLLVALVVAHTVLPTLNWLNVSLNVVSAVALWWLVLAALLGNPLPLGARMGLLLVALGYTGWYLYVLLQLLVAEGAPGEIGVGLYTLGELAAVLAPLAFFAAVAAPDGEWKRPLRWLFPVLVAVIFAAANLADAVMNTGFAGVLTTWSLGFNLVWPWPLYAISIALYLYALLTCLAGNRAPRSYSGRDRGLGLFLLLLAGLNLQLPYQHLLALLAVALLARHFTPFYGAGRTKPQLEPERPILNALGSEAGPRASRH